MPSGIYLIENIITGKRYVGSSQDIDVRIVNHFNGNGSVAIKRAIAKYGKDALVVSILELCSCDDLLRREAVWIDKLNPEYNNTRFTAGGRVVFCEASRRKMSLAKLGKPSSQLGRKRSADARRKMSLAKLGKPGNRLGKKHNEVARLKMSKAAKGRKLSEEHKARIRTSSGGWHHSAESKERIAAGQRGRSRTRSQEEREAISKAVTARWRDPVYRAQQAAVRSKISPSNEGGPA